MIFIILSNYFRILTPQITGYVVNSVEKELRNAVNEKHPGQNASSDLVQQKNSRSDTANYDILVKKFVRSMDMSKQSFGRKVAYSGIILLVLALIGGFFMFLMRQTVIVMSRHIEFDQKNEIYQHYQSSI